PASGPSTLALHDAFRSERRPPGGPGRWQRTNYADRTVSLLGGVAQAAGTTLALLGAGRTGAAAAVAAGTGGLLGAVDDLTERERSEEHTSELQSRENLV